MNRPLNICPHNTSSIKNKDRNKEKNPVRARQCTQKKDNEESCNLGEVWMFARCLQIMFTKNNAASSLE
jgi:hypothetical protein